MITSTQNERIKYVRSLARRRNRMREGRFVVEGTRLVDEMARAGLRPALVLYTSAWATTPAARRLMNWMEQATDGAWPVSDAVLAACSDTQAPPGVLAVAEMGGRAATPVATGTGEARHPTGRGPIVILDRLRDPGNLGTILRSAEAAGAEQVILTPETVDVYNPKVVRAAMGSHFRLSIACLGWPAVGQLVEGRVVWLADPRAGVSYDRVDWVKPGALIVGGEATGASHEAESLATGCVWIPMAAPVESLNAAMAATVILFEAARQRRLDASPFDNCFSEHP